MIPHAERLIGRRITRCPPCLRLPAAQGVPSEREPDDRRMRVLVAHNPRLPTTPAWHRFRLMRDDMTVRQYLTRGGRRGDIRLAVARGWIALEGKP
jgi:hypothetical protein